MPDMEETSGAGGPAAEHEASVVRYYTSQLLLRVVANDDYDPDGASFAAFGATHNAPFLSIADAHLVPPLLLRAPSAVVVPSSADDHDSKLRRGVFTVIPAEGFVKEPGQPVYYNDPIELMDQRGRLLGIVTRAPFAGHLAADGHSGALVFVLERHNSRCAAIGTKFMQRELRKSVSLPLSETSEGSSNHSDVVGRRGGRPSRSSLVEVCGGERLRIVGLERVSKKQFPGEAIMQHRPEESQSSGRKSVVQFIEEPPYLTCEIVLTTPAPRERSETVQSSSTNLSLPSATSKKGKTQIADRTATGDFVGVLHSGILHRRSDHMKLWKKRFFVLTQVALHRFDIRETLETIKTQKARGSIYLRDCRGVRYERFSRPHELEIELNDGKVYSLHAVDALTCSDWASVLSRAIENPYWIHAERGIETVWRSDHQFNSPRCPAVTKVILRPGQNKLLRCMEEGAKLVSRSPQWSEKVSLGSITANGFVIVQLADGHAFRITLQDLSRSLVHPTWIAVSTSLEVARIQSLDEDNDDLPDNLSREMPVRKSEIVADEKSPFLVRLKFQADLQLDQRLTRRGSQEWERKIVLIVFACVVLLPAIAYGHRQSLDHFARSLCAVTGAVLAVVVAASSPVVWHLYLWMRESQHIEGELHWFLTLLALEVRPHRNQRSDRMSTSSGEDTRSRVESFICADDDDESNDGAIVVPTKTPLYGYEKGLKGRSDGAASPEAIRTYRLENALDSILSRPQLSFFAIKKYFPTRFLPRDEHGRRVLLVSLNKVNRKALAAHNVSAFNIGRYFMYLWEFIWSYQDMQEGVAQSQIVLIVDCMGWRYFKWFGIECQVMMQLLDKTYRNYPGRLARVVFARDKASFGVYGKLIGRSLDSGLRDIVETQPSLGRLAQDVDNEKRSSDEVALVDFVTNVLSTHANVTVPSFSHRELEQATRFSVTGSLKEDGEETSPIDEIGTRAVTMPANAEAIEWDLLLKEPNVQIWRSKDAEVAPPVNGRSYQSDARVAQWRGRLQMKSTSIESVLKLLRDPVTVTTWMDNSDEVVVLDKLSRHEDICLWSRRVPFMSFSISGHRGDGNHAQKNPFFHCAVRRIHDLKKGRGQYDRVGTVMWKTTSAQRVVVDSPVSSIESHVQWRKLEDPVVSLCIVVEEGLVGGKKHLALNIWFQSLAPPTTPKQAKEIGDILAQKMRALDAAVGKVEQTLSLKEPSNKRFKLMTGSTHRSI